MPHSEQIIHLKKKKKLFTKKLSTFDKLVLVVSVAYPLSALPQAIQVMEGNAAGVSVLSWSSFMACAALFLVYGLKNRVFPMIISNILWVFMDGLVIVGILLQNVA